ncbi:putative gamma-glutamyltransferase [Oesophagostomum dentatum]|uniref:Putative gamma-glutamyltransferase n=1 Tax=Oesophagostomum dentatum TaxID=61180 RepID=A0A0B1SS34_OESDE|nr:putative gamma-glutamyltransferase [Oesophagostomum dentatum]
MIEGGNAVDSMIATLLCVGVVNPQSSGIGGGFLMTLYNASTGRCQTINARETAPLAATENMFVNDTSQSVYGYRSIATPSEIHGFWTVFKKFGSGKVKWAQLFEPAVNLAINGFPVSSNLASQLSDKETLIQAEPTMKEVFVDHSTGRVYEEGDIMKRERYGFTLQLIANATDPVDLFYKGGMAQTIAGEITDNGGHITQKDLASYETIIDEIPLIATGLPGDLEMCGPPPPSSFVITQSIIAVMAEFYRGGKVNLNDPLVYHRLIEAEKFAYAQRTKLGDVKFVESAKALVANMSTPKYTKWIASMIKDVAQPQSYYMGDDTTQVPDHGTSHVTVIDDQGNAVSCTSTINQIFGSMRISTTLGIIWNDEMDDFSTPGVPNAFGFAPSPSNFIAPGKRPMSSMSPMVIYNKNDNSVSDLLLWRISANRD